MIRFSYAKIGDVSCADCYNIDFCKKDRFQNLPTPNSHVCKYFRKRKVKPRVRDAKVDYNQLIHQLSTWSCIAKGVKREHMSADWYGGFKLSDDRPSFTECDILIKLNKIFMDYVFEFKEMLIHSESILEILIQTVYSVNMEDNSVSIYTEDKLLRDRMEDYLHSIGYKLKGDTYENIMGIKVRKRRMDYIVF